jgi:uncharacterized MAPEG superfamily protein
MEGLMNNAAFQVYAACSAILVLKMFAVTIATGIARTRTKATTNPEDAPMLGYTVRSDEPPEVQRVHRLHRNDMENIPAFFAIGLIYVLIGASAVAAQAYFITFTVARILHTVTYLAHLQPWRTITFTIGFLCMLGISIQVLFAVL